MLIRYFQYRALSKGRISRFQASVWGVRSYVFQECSLLYNVTMCARRITPFFKLDPTHLHPGFMTVGTIFGQSKLGSIKSWVQKSTEDN